MKNIFTSLFILAGLMLNAQTIYTIQNSTDTIGCVDGGILHDTGGALAGYGNNESFAMTLCTDSAEVLALEVVSNTFATGDFLCLYDGVNTTAPLLHCFNSNTSLVAGSIIRAGITNTSGCLTIQFVSDAALTGNFEYALSCKSPCQSVIANVNVTDPAVNPLDTNYIDLCFQDTVQFFGNAIFSQNNIVYNQSNANSSFYWGFGDEATDSILNPTHFYDDDGIYQVTLTVIDSIGCQSVNEIPLRIRKSPLVDLEFVLPDSVLCLEDIELVGVLRNGGEVEGILQGDSITFTGEANFVDTVFLPDDSDGLSWNTFSTPVIYPLVIGGYQAGSTLTNLADFIEICLDIEHSYIGDLDIIIECPNQQQAVVLNNSQPGSGGVNVGGVFFGIPNHNDNGLQPLNAALNPAGTPFNYCWSPSATLGDIPTEIGNVNPGGALIPDTYDIQGNWNDLIGCPLNGSWSIQILDDFGGDNGWTFSASIKFNPLLLAANDTFPLTYSNANWDPNPNIVSLPIDTDYISIGSNDVNQNMFYFNLEDQFGCQFRDSLEIFYDEFEVEITPEDTTVCTGDPVPLTTQVFDATSPITYSWSPTTDLNDPTLQSPTSTLTGAGQTYVVAATSQYNCTFYDTATVTPSASFEFDAFGDTTICAGDTVQLFTTGGATSYLWTPNNGTISDPTAANPFVFPTTTTTYNVQGDSTGCSQFRNITISVSNINIAVLLPTAATCGIANGSLLAFANGAAPGNSLSFSLDGGIPQSNGIYNNLFGGLRLLEISDGTGCSIDTLVSLGGGAPLVIDTVILENATCGNLNDGTINVQLVDPTIIATYTNDSTGVSQNNGVFTGLAGGTYTISISNAGCPTIDTTISITQPDSILLTVDSFSDVTCFNDNDGALTLSATGGTAAYTYAIDGINYQASGVFNLLDSGVYYLSVEDANNCFALDTIVLSTPDSLVVANLVVDSVDCFGGLAVISFDGQGGTAPYTYSIDALPAFGPNNIFNQPAGNYTIQVQDTNNCFSNIVLDTIFEPTLLSFAVDSVLNSNCNNPDGAIYVTTQGGTLPYQYSWSDGTNVVSTSEDLINFVSGIYTLTLTDDNGCTFQLSRQIFDNAALTLSIESFDSISCFGDNDATVALNADFGLAPYSFSVNNGAVQADSVFTNIAGGLNTFEVTDATGCSFTTQITIYEPTDFVLSTTIVDLTCDEANNGEIIVNATGGTLPYSFALNTTIPQTSNQFDNLLAANYTAYITDANTCEDSIINVVVNMPDTLVITSVNKTDVSCFGANDGQIIVTATGGTLPYAFSINGGAPQASNIFTPLSGGIYNITVTDANLCPFAEATDTIIEPTEIVMTDSTANLTCFGAGNGYIELAATGGTAPYTYSINGGANYTNNNTFSLLDAGVYNLIVLDANTCPSTMKTITITEPVQMQIIGSSSDVTCFDSNDGRIVLSNIIGGTAPYQISINGAASQNFTANMVLGNLLGATYTITVTDTIGCSATRSFTINQPVELVLEEADLTNVSCFGEGDGIVEVSATGGMPGYNFIFEGLTESSNTNMPVQFQNVDVGVFPVYVFDANLCSDTILVEITEPNQLLIDSIVLLNEISCFGVNDAALLVFASGGYIADTIAGNYTYFWSPSGITDHKAAGLAPGVHTVTVTDDNGCSIDASYTIAAVDPILATATPDSVTINMGDTTMLGVNVQNAMGALTYSWTPSTGLSCTDCQNPNVTVYNDIVYSVVVTDTNGCSNYNFTESFVFVNDSLFYFIPNSFTPNGDGINDAFHVFGQDIQDVSMMVFNRWGQMVFMGNNQFETWDGTYQGIDQPGGVYTYTAVITFLNGATVTKNGSITILR